MGQKANSALKAIPAPADRDEWLKITMAYKAADGDFQTWDEWSKGGGETYDAAGNAATWKSIDPSGKIGAGTLYMIAKEHGWEDQHASNDADLHDHHAKAKAKSKAPAPAPKRLKEIADYIDAAMKTTAPAVEYLATRGINAETAAHFKVGWDENSTFHLVCPYVGADTPYYWARRTDIAPNEKRKDADGKTIRKGDYPYGLPKQIYNVDALNAGADVVFIVEGQIDVMSFYQIGAHAVGSNDTAELIREIEKRGTDAKCFAIIADDDAAGASKAASKKDTLTAAGYRAFIYPMPADYHDANDIFMKAPADFYEWTRNAGAYYETQKQEACKEYSQITGAARLPALDALIKKNAQRQLISTGFPSLDDALSDIKGVRGGIYTGLYVIGAITSLGKTTFAMQIADSIAAQGADVLIFSLEMSALELMAKSISRLTYEGSFNESIAKTYRGITEGGRYGRYSNAERDAISGAIEKYKSFADRVFIKETDLRRLKPSDVAAEVKKHVETTGRTPIVIVDYLQVLAPEDERATDKMNIDTAISNMKAISKRFDTPVIVISSFNRDNYNEKVSLKAFKESGGIDYTCDVVLGLHLVGAGSKDFDVDAAKSATPREVEAVLLKNRGAKTGETVRFEYDARFNYFRDVMMGHAEKPLGGGEFEKNSINLPNYMKKKK